VFRPLAVKSFGIASVNVGGKQKADILCVSLIMSVVPSDQFQDRKPGAGCDGDL
jgi:hypothetical protein